MRGVEGPSSICVVEVKVKSQNGSSLRMSVRLLLTTVDSVVSENKRVSDLITTFE